MAVSAARLAPLALTLAAAVAGGGLFVLAGLPAPWLAGGSLATAGLALARVGGDVPDPLVNAALLVLGASMGTGVTPEAVALMGTWPGSLAGLVLSVDGIIGGSTLFLVMCGWDRMTALYASLPGALTATLVLAAQSGADVPRVAVAQTLRVLVLVALVPLVAVGVGDGAVRQAAAAAPDLAEILLVAAVCVPAGWLAHRLRVPAGLLLGAFAASAALHVTGVATAPLPDLVVIPGFVLLAAMIGRRFAVVSAREIVRLTIPAVGLLVVGTLVSIGSALVVSRLAGLPLAQVFIAYAPGGLEAMILMAPALGIDPAYVAVHQVTRFLAILAMLPFLTAAIRRWP